MQRPPPPPVWHFNLLTVWSMFVSEIFSRTCVASVMDASWLCDVTFVAATNIPVSLSSIVSNDVMAVSVTMNE